jgi:small subunit ribosomal protein S20
MPNTKSAKKRHRQSLVRRQRNRAAKSVLKTQVRKVREAITAGEVEKAADELRATTKKLDQTAARGIIHRNVASRLKSRLSAALKRAVPSKDGAAKAAPATKPAKAAKATKAKKS